MPPSRNNTVKFTDLQPISSVNPGDIIPVVDTSVPTLVNKKINVQDFSRSLPVSQQVTQIGAVSGNWNSNYTTTQSNSATWSTGGTYGTVYSQNSAKYESAYSNVLSNSANWDSAYATVQSSSAAWTGLTTYTTVNSLSDTWNTGYSLASSAYTSLNTLSTGYWLLKSGDQLTGALTTTKTITANFTLDELVSKRYVDAMAAATQISGNFVPSLYYTKADFTTGVIPVLSATTLQTNAFTIGVAGGANAGVVSFDPNLYGTGVTGYILNSTNNRSGLRVICGTYARFNVSEQGLGYAWGGPTFQQNIFTLGDSSGNNVIAVDHYGQFHAAPLTNSVVLRSTSPFNFFIRNYSNIFLDVPTVSGHSFIADQYAVQNDGRIYNAFASPAAHNIQFATNNTFFTGNGLRTLSIAENIAPGNGGIWMRSDRIVGWSTGGDPANSGDLRLKRIGASSLALDSGGTANTPSFTVYGNISGSGSVQTLSSFIVEQNSSTNEITPEFTGMWLVRNTARHGIASTYFGTAISMLGFYYNNVGIGGIQQNGGFIVPSGAGFGWSNSSAGNLTFPYGRIGFYREGEFNIGLRAYDETFSKAGFSDASLKIYKMFTDTSNYERLALSGNRIAYEFAGTGVARDLTITTPGNLILSAAGSLSFSQSLPTSFSGLQGTAPSNPSSSYFKILSSNNLTLFNINSAGRVAIRGRSSSVTEDQMNFPSRELELVGFTQPIMFRHYGSNTGFIVDEYGHGLNSDVAGCWLGASGTGARLQLWGGGPLNGVAIGTGTTGFLNTYSNGKVAIGRNSIYAGSLTSPTSAHVAIVTDSAMNSFTSDILVLSAGPNVSILNYINCLSADRTIFSVNSAGQFNTANIAADFINLNQVGGSATYNTGVLRIPNDVTGQFRPGIWSYGATTGTPQPAPTSVGADVSLATFGGGSHNNQASLFSNAIISRRGVFTPNTPTLGSGNFDELITDLALKVAGRIGFTDTSLGTSSQVRPISATMGYDWGTNLIALSSRGANVNSGFYFYPTGTSHPWPASIYIDQSSFLNLNVAFGAGKSIRFTDGNIIPFSVGFPSNGIITTGDAIFNAYNSTTSNVTINQGASQTNTTLFRILSSNSTAIVSVSSDGICRFNNNVFVKPNGLIQFTNTSSTTPALKGTTTTVQARTGDDSQYTYLQGKLQTDQAANAGTFTPDKYIILYDSTGTAYKVPVQAL